MTILEIDTQARGVLHKHSLKAGINMENLLSVSNITEAPSLQKSYQPKLAWPYQANLPN